jgi:hypothetical protein
MSPIAWELLQKIRAPNLVLVDCSDSEAASLPHVVCCQAVLRDLSTGQTASSLPQGTLQGIQSLPSKWSTQFPCFSLLPQCSACFLHSLMHMADTPGWMFAAPGGISWRMGVGWGSGVSGNLLGPQAAGIIKARNGLECKDGKPLNSTLQHLLYHSCPHPAQRHHSNNTKELPLTSPVAHYPSPRSSGFQY